MYLQLLPRKNVEGNTITFHRFQVNKTICCVWLQRSKLTRKWQLSNLFPTFYLFPRTNKTIPVLFYISKKNLQNFCIYISIYVPDIHLYFQCNVGMGLYCLRSFVCPNGRQTYRSNENSVNDDLNLSSVRYANFAFKLHNTRTYMYSLRNCYMHEQYPAVNYSPHSERFL